MVATHVLEFFVSSPCLLSKIGVYFQFKWIKHFSKKICVSIINTNDVKKREYRWILMQENGWANKQLYHINNSNNKINPKYYRPLYLHLSTSTIALKKLL